MIRPPRFFLVIALCCALTIVAGIAGGIGIARLGQTSVDARQTSVDACDAANRLNDAFGRLFDYLEDRSRQAGRLNPEAVEFYAIARATLDEARC